MSVVNAVLFLLLNTIYVSPTTVDDYLGCYVDNTRREKLLKRYRNDERELTPGYCIRFCHTRSYPLAGLQFSKQCFCGHSVENGTAVPDKECYYKCDGDFSFKCGGDLRLSVYRTGFKAVETIGGYLGCYRQVSADPRPSRSSKETFEGRLTNTVCRHFCTRNGFRYAATQSGTTCHCSNERPSYKTTADDEDCSDTCQGSVEGEMCGAGSRFSVYETSLGDRTINPVIDLYEGCFPISFYDRTPTKNSNLLTAQYCVGHCYRKNFRLAGMKLGNQCYCTNSLDAGKVLLSSVGDELCSSPCKGNAAQMCGGKEHISFYSTGIPGAGSGSDYVYVGCYSEAGGGTASGPSWEHRRMTPGQCSGYCFTRAYRYAATESGYRCFCSDRIDEEAKSFEQACGSRCYGDGSQMCGGKSKLSIYDTGYFEYRSAAGKLCESSPSEVSGVKVCRDKVLFEEDFAVDTLRADRWSHVIRMPNAPDYPFVIYRSDERNVFVRNGSLVIRPTLMDDARVQRGSIHLTNCTGFLSEECSRQAVSFSILPPVESAMITTGEAFSFKYGRVEIRAKLPSGDWLVPVIWLEPKRRSYGAQYRGGRIVVAMSRGNSGGLKCNVTGAHLQDMGNGRLEAGISAADDIDRRYKKMFHWQSQEGWSKQYHNYTFLWSPDNLSWSVDGGRPKTLMKQDQRISDLFVDPKAKREASWSSGSSVAPFDEEFSISLGVYAGGMTDFPDDCKTGDFPKPWTNFGIKAMANFWQAKQSWSETWDAEDSALYVDHVKVTSI